MDNFIFNTSPPDASTNKNNTEMAEKKQKGRSKARKKQQMIQTRNRKTTLSTETRDCDNRVIIAAMTKGNISNMV